MQLLNHQNAICYSLYSYNTVSWPRLSEAVDFGQPPEVFPKCSSFQKVPSNLPFGNAALSKPLRALRSEKSFLKALSVLKMEIIHPSKKH